MVTFAYDTKGNRFESERIELNRPIFDLAFSPDGFSVIVSERERARILSIAELDAAGQSRD